MPAGHLATNLDQEMLERHGISIAPRTTLDAALPLRTGPDVAMELGGRYLLRYLSRDQLRHFVNGSTVPHWVTPTALSPSEAGPFLALPHPDKPRRYVMLIDPSAITQIRGPRWVRGGVGIEYLLPVGFPSNALPMPFELEVK
jgi:hypothetical protein